MMKTQKRPSLESSALLRRSGWVVVIALMMASVACGGSTRKSRETKDNAVSTPKPASPPVVAAAAKSEAAEEQEVREPQFDAVESETNRDPFRPYLKEFLTRPEQVAKIQRKVILQRYGLEELQLIAVVAGRTNPLAMFRDPGGLGVTVKRGDYISKSAGRVKQILPDKVVVEIQEHLEGRDSIADRVIDLHPKEAPER